MAGFLLRNLLPFTDRRARALHDTYSKADRELFWRFSLTEEGRGLANRQGSACKSGDGEQSVKTWIKAGRGAWVTPAPVHEDTKDVVVALSHPPRRQTLSVTI